MANSESVISPYHETTTWVNDFKLWKKLPSDHFILEYLIPKKAAFVRWLRHTICTDSLDLPSHQDEFQVGVIKNWFGQDHVPDIQIYTFFASEVWFDWKRGMLSRIIEIFNLDSCRRIFYFW